MTMKNSTFWKIPLLLLILAFSRHVCAQNIIPNGNFESGAVSWAGTYSIETTSVQQGTKACRIDAPGFAGAQQDITSLLEPNTIYKFSGWGKLQSASSAYNQIGIIVKGLDGGDTYYPKLEWTTETTYTYKEQTFVTPPSFQQISVRVFKEDNGNIFWGDDVQLVKVQDTQAPDKPAGLQAIAKDVSVLLKWNASNDNAKTTSYDVYRNGTLVANTTTTYLNLTGLTNNTTYSLTVKAKDRAGNVSLASDPLSVTTQTPSSVSHFTVQGTKVFTPSGVEFKVRGTNVSGPGWVWDRETTQDADLIKNVWNFNTVRVDIIPANQGWTVNKDLDLIVNTFTSRNVVTIIEHHAFTGRYPTGYELDDLKSWWVDKAFKYKDNPYVWFNIMNEPGNADTAEEIWKTSHDEVIKAIRQDVGAKNIIMLDGSQFGQENGYQATTSSSILTYGQYFTSTYSGIMFSVHVYDRWVNGQTRFENYFDAMTAKNLCIQVGEYGNITTATAPMFNAAIPRNVGRIMWHWDGTDGHRLTEGTTRGGGFEVDKTDGTKPTNLSWLGNLIWDDNHGGTLVANSTDLAVVDVVPGKATFGSGTQMNFSATVRNTGLKDIAAGSKVSVRFLVNNTEISSTIVDAPLPMGKGITVISGNYTATGSSLSVRAEILAAGSTYGTDANAANNGRTVAVNGGSSASSGYDLVITDISVGTTDPLNYDETAQLSVSVKNQGNAAVAASLNKLVTFKVDGEAIASLTNTATSIAPGQTVTLGPVAWRVSATKDFQLAAFLKADAAELVVDNNSLFKTFAMASEINFIKNGGFEQDLTYWTNWGQMSVNTDLSNVKSGAKSLRVTSSAAGGGGNDVTLEPNTTYKLSAWGKNDVAPTAGSSDIGTQYNNLGTGIQDKYFLNFTETAWTYKEVTFTTPASFSNANAFVWKQSAGVNFYADDIKLVKYTATTLAAPTGLVANAGDASVSLSWTAVSGATGYQVWAKAGTGSFAQVSTPATNSYNHTGLVNGTLYTYYVIATNGTSQSAASSQATATPVASLRNPDAPAGTVAGLDYKYFEGTWSVLPDFNTLTPVKTGTVANLDLTPRNISDNFGFQFKGFISVPSDGTYTFYTSSDDGSRLYIGTTLIVDNDGLHGAQERSGSIGLKAGKHSITINYFELNGGESLAASYEGPSITKAAIPNAAFFRTPLTTSTNLALNKTATSSANESASMIPANAVDGNGTTRWASAYSDPQWIQVDLGASYSISRVVLSWEAAFGSSYQIQLSSDASTWSTIYSTTSGDGGTDDLTGLTGTGRYIRMYGTARSTSWGYSLYEFEVYGTAASSTTGTISRDTWSNVTGGAVTDIPLATTPTSTGTLTSFEIPSNTADNYATRVRGYVVPTTSGSYTFYLSGDDQCQLLLSTDENASNKTKIAEITGWTNSREWNKYASQTSAATTLTAGQRYYVEALHKEATGGDNLAVGWTGPGIATITVIPGSNLAPYGTGARLATQTGEEEMLVFVYPNPAKDVFHVVIESVGEDDCHLALFDQTGRSHVEMVQRLVRGENKISVSVSSVPSGLYFLKIESARQRSVKKILVQ